jgi:hypothetical protein
VLHHGGADSFDDVISGVETAEAQLMGHDLVGPSHVCAFSLEITGSCALNEEFPRFSCVVEVVGRWFLSPCDTCRTRPSSISRGADLMTQIQSKSSS